MIQISNLKLSYADQFIFEIKNLNIMNEKTVIGIIGNNGTGKTSFAKIIAGLENSYTGIFKNTFTTFYLEQNYFRSNDVKLSGGEFCKQQIIEIFQKQCELLILDEVTVHLDYDNRKFLMNSIRKFKGIILLISHDPNLIEETATEILEIEDNKINLFKMNYNAYLFENENLTKQKQLSLFHYKQQKEKLEMNIKMQKINSQNSDRKPTRMSESDARLISSYNYQGKKNVDKNLKSLKTKLNKLVTEKPIYEFNKKISFTYGPILKQKNIIYLEEYNFKISNNDKVFICGNNGIGKTTLLNKIYQKLEKEYKTDISIGYLKQNMDDFYLNYTVVEYLKEMSTDNISNIRGLLSQFKYSETTFHKKLVNLSEGEKIQLHICILLTKKTNVLLLDEPTNYLDIKSIEMFEEAIKQYDGTTIIISHDQNFIKKIGGKILYLKEPN
ncbi:ATP-binding cassette domain-containing protein [Spiroplasma endosymbiont of Labia minor]|uniref:ATP-binding cassette domain-containing protein n=1 Tax=Spiroplasma endosymbiont of Labia minor TaxID=3066305 RepID=UPI0030CFA2D4